MQEPWNATTLLTEAMNLTEGVRSDRDLVEAVRQLICLESAVRAALSHAVAVTVSQGAHESAGHATTADLLRSECHLSGREANELAASSVRLREHLHCTFVALQAGMITWAHATTLVRAVDRLGLDVVLGTEHAWIELIATRTGPEALQRVVHTRRLEQVGFPARRTPEPQVDENVSTSSNTSDTGPGAPAEATSVRDDTGTRTSAGADDEHRDLDESRSLQQPAHGAGVDPNAATAPVQLTAPTLTLSSDNTSAEKSAAATPGCVHQGCATEASLRDISFTVHWLDGDQSEILGCGLLCEDHAAALTTCSVSRIRVGHRTTIRTIGPALVTEAA